MEPVKKLNLPDRFVYRPEYEIWFKSSIFGDDLPMIRPFYALHEDLLKVISVAATVRRKLLIYARCITDHRTVTSRQLLAISHRCSIFTVILARI
jgi:hypothetical protein